MIHSEEYEVSWHDTDASRNIKVSALIRLMQETANKHCDKNGLPREQLRDVRGLAFFLSKIAVNIYDELKAYDAVRVETWISDGKGFSFPRCFRVWKDNRIIAEAVSIWALIRLSDHSLVKCTDFSYGFSSEPVLEIEAPLRVHGSLEGELVCSMTRKVLWSDIDYNWHMNNTHYPDWICDAIKDMGQRTVSSVTISYLREARFDEEMQIQLYRRSESEFYFQMTGPEGICSEARLVAPVRK